MLIIARTVACIVGLISLILCMTCILILQAWVQMMANHTHSIDTNHLVTIGYEGFWGEYDADVQYNPGNGWAGITGQNFSQNVAHDEIDFAEIHFWPDLWFADQQNINTDVTTFLTNWFNQHAAVAHSLNKPLLEEFGKAVNVSNGFCHISWCPHTDSTVPQLLDQFQNKPEQLDHAAAVALLF